VTEVGRAASIAIVAMLLIAGCAAISSSTGGDPMLAAELASVSLVAAWLAHATRAAQRALAHASSLSILSREASVSGTAVRILADPAPLAFVSGLFRPQIYLSPSLIDILDDRELRAVLLHEWHHRTTRAPLRSLVLEAWHRTLVWLPPARRALLARLAALEIEADAAAVAAGVQPATLASALLKCDPHSPAAASAFSTAAEVRIGELVAWGRGERAERRRSLPLEWAAPAGAAIALLACHLVGA
jgi:hypothetical protein